MQFFSILFAAVLLAQIAAAKTTTITFNAANMKVGRTATGYCWTGSIASLRSDAYRCMIGNSIHDPCFSLNPKSVACPTNVVANTGIRISLNKPLPRSNPNAAPNAWMMTLAGGPKCNMGTGTIIPGYPFYCTGDMVCAAPLSAGTKPAAVFVTCGRPQGGRSVSGTGRYLVTMMYQ